MLFKSKQKEKENVFPMIIEYAAEKIQIENKEELKEFIKHCNKKGYENLKEIKINGGNDD